MTTADRWTRTVREQLGLGRLLPLGGPGDGAWIAERAAREVLLAAARGVAGVRPKELRIALADPGGAYEPAVPPPPSALPPGPLRVTADFAATLAEPLPATAARLRAALATATRRLGLTVTDVDLRATDLLETASAPESGTASETGTAPEAATGGGPRPSPAVDRKNGDEGRAADAALAVVGVARLTDVLGRPVDVTESSLESALPRRHVRVELAVDADHRAVEVARQVRVAVSGALADRPSVAVLVTAVG
ncbi:nucleopolyhedrovirus P10 family protein [Streptomyces lancefieldiae]|uniref:Nucleopolyhedrovirus P10 family protein n=1 Tax=Streptomyces lancefieldiae TaxID=3075520 RepID=A0ABU3AKB9_9ACTN|nr:nucleopolyhedrovirus P10 family protein [Streptomyces sp. DSM 40712]MDT0610628.1 nucleopolyhedrovirus P10 family protein [Streptomyces sp. DSM 40712]